VRADTGLPALAGGSVEADAAGGRRDWEVYAVAGLFGLGILALGIVPSPLFDLAVDAGAALGNLV
jgi:hypothetical protein